MSCAPSPKSRKVMSRCSSRVKPEPARNWSRKRFTVGRRAPKVRLWRSTVGDSGTAAGIRAVRSCARRIHGAVANKPGRIQAAQGGSIFLDEIGEMPMPLQVKLLRVLQERVIVRVGDTRPEPVDVRVLSATHRDLPTEIRTGRFREDLFYRLNVVQVQLPPLRERGDDVLLLARSFCGALPTS